MLQYIIRLVFNFYVESTIFTIPSPQCNADPMATGAFKRVRTQFIAALGDATATSGTGAEHWGLWRLDPGPRGVRLRDYAKLGEAKVAPAGWAFDSADFWIEEHGLLMERPEIPMVPASATKARRFVVTGDREVTTVLTVSPDGAWSLEKGSLYGVTHLPCRTGRYQPANLETVFRPEAASLALFPVSPGTPMPSLPHCQHKDYGHTHTNTHTCTHIYTDALTPTHTHTYSHSCIHTRINTHNMHIHEHTHTRTHTHTHTYTHIRSCAVCRGHRERVRSRLRRNVVSRQVCEQYVTLSHYVCSVGFLVN
jgi:hypothetical protein